MISWVLSFKKTWTKIPTQHTRIFEIPHTWVSCAGLGDAWGWICLVIMENPRGQWLMTTPNASRLTIPTNPFPQAYQGAGKGSFHYERSSWNLPFHPRKRSHPTGVSGNKGGLCINRGLFHYLDVPLEVSKRIGSVGFNPSIFPCL